MSCEEIEISILEYQENRLDGGRRDEVETHLADCAGCRILAHQLLELDAALAVNLKVPVMSAGFARRLEERILTAPGVLSEAQRAERKRQLQSEFEAGMAQIARRSFGLDRIWRHLTWPTLAVAAGWLAWRFTPQWTIHLAAQSNGDLPPNLLPWLTASLVFVVVAVADIRPWSWRVWRFW